MRDFDRLTPSVAWCAAALLRASPLVAQSPKIPPLPPPSCAKPEDSRIEVTLVGSYHMSNPGADQFNLEADDVLTERRQREIASLVDRLVAYRPTKIAVEAPWGDSLSVARWEGYRRGERELRRSEEEQVGFRLAKLLGHDRIYQIDVRLSLPFGEIEAVVGADPRFGRNMQQVDSIGRWAMQLMANKLASGTVGEMLYMLNLPDAIEYAHVPYSYFVPIVRDTNYAGADMVAEWYRRNLRIFANLTRIAEPRDRIFVIYGMGHIKILKDLVIQHPQFCLVDPLPYLR